MSEERSMDARRYDYLAFVRVLNLLKEEPPKAAKLLIMGECAIRALHVWAYLDKGARAGVDPRFRPGESEGP